MDINLQNFRAWFVDILNGLYPTRNAGIAVFMISLPLAERYLRQTGKVGPDKELSDACMRELVRIFPGLRDVPTAKKFWNVYRHGFLHQSTLSLFTRGGAPLPAGWITHDNMTEAIEIRADGSFSLHPVLFSQTIIREIEAAFDVFVGVGSSAPPLPTVARLDPVTIPSTYLGTGNRP
jgi:hypothetical protein